MNLLMDDWIPVQKEGVFQHISLKAMLTQDKSWQITLPRDDMEMACLQLLVSLTQVLFIPEDKAQLKKKIAQPLTESDYADAIEDKVDWFELDHPKAPFMQVREVKAKEPNPMVKLFAGFTESTSSTFVNEPGLADSVCPSCAAIGLFNQANSCASFCGGAKGSIRGNLKGDELKSGVPITTLVSADSLREKIWLNILTQEHIEKYLLIEKGVNDKPNWVDLISTVGVSKNKIKQGEDVQLNKLGLLRGLFWQPQHIELLLGRQSGVCDSCGRESICLYTGFLFEKFSYTYKGFWIHPHSPLKWTVTKGEKKLGYRSFNSQIPIWTHLIGLLINEDAEKGGHSPAPVISQFKKYFILGKELHLLVGGYWTKPGKASINERRHEVFNISEHLSKKDIGVEDIVNIGLAYKKELDNSFYFIKKDISSSAKIPKPIERFISGMASQAEHRFYKQTELLVHSMLRDMDFKESKAAFTHYHQQLHETTRTIFKKITEPYQNEPKMIKALAIARRGLDKELKKLKEIA
ncbi:MAG: type I-E CRISPR-associated protein Cse1/CasA [Thiotrichaceae bacterium]|nr:type I-E CRISPR-associated protein Cse1/CasA [Thiotrichaceae bacterium]